MCEIKKKVFAAKKIGAKNYAANATCDVHSTPGFLNECVFCINDVYLCAKNYLYRYLCVISHVFFLRRMLQI